MLSLNVGRNAVALASLLILFTLEAHSGNHGYFTAYTHHINRGERELMLMNDFTVPSSVNRQEGQKEYFSQMLELEYALTDRFAMEIMAESFFESGGSARFTGFRLENRYLLIKNDRWWNPMLYAEYEHLDASTRYKMEVSGWIHAPYETEEDEESVKDERILETRFILSRDFGLTNAAFNWINETDLRNGRTDFGYAIGIMRSTTSEHHQHGEEGEQKSVSLAGYGFELIGGLGDDRRLSLRPKDQQHYLQPVILLHLPQGWMLHSGVALGLTPASDRVLFRLAFAHEF